MGCLKIFRVNGKKANEDGHTDMQTDRLPKWFLVLHFAAKNKNKLPINGADAQKDRTTS